MSEIVLQNKSSTGENLSATFLPEKGMNLISFKCNDIEVIDQSTRTLFDERYAGLGALIGPHFHHRKVIPPIKDESLFPHIARVKAKGIQEPFSHGIGRYAPWKAEATQTKVKAVLTGKDTWNGIPLAELEGQNFKMTFLAELTPEGLILDLAVVSDTASLVGIHYYYHLPNNRGTVISRIQNNYIENNERKKIPEEWHLDAQHTLKMPLDRNIDWTLYPFPKPLEGNILLDTETHQVHTTYWCASQENSWQLYHPEGASFACIEPISSQDPRHPNLTVSSIRIQLRVLTGDRRQTL